MQAGGLLQGRPDLLALYGHRVTEAAAGDPSKLSLWSRLVLRLTDRLGGDPSELVVPPIPLDWDLQRVIFETGEHIAAATSVLMAPGAPSRCYENAAHGWLAGRWDRIGIGYALGPGDGLWREHAVGVSLEDSMVLFKLHETTVARDAYFLAGLNEFESGLFTLTTCPSLEAFSMADPARILAINVVIEELQASQMTLGRGLIT